MSETSATEIVRLDQRVTSLEARLKSIGEVVGRIDTKLDERGKTNWGLLVSIAVGALAFIGAIGTLAYSHVTASLSRLETGLTGIKGRINADERSARDTYVGKSDFATVLQAVKERRDDAQRTTEVRFARVEADVDVLQKAVVPRGEHERQWGDQRRLDDAQADQIKESRHRLESDYMPKAALEMLQHRVDDVERRVNARGGWPPVSRRHRRSAILGRGQRCG